MDFLKKIFGGGNDGTGQKARDRLRIVLIHDRTDISPQLLDNLRSEMIQLLTKYMDIDTSKIEIDLDRDERAVALVANVPVLRIKRGGSNLNDEPRPPRHTELHEGSHRKHDKN